MNAELKTAPLVQQLTLVDCKEILKFWDKIQEWMTKLIYDNNTDTFSSIYIYIYSHFSVRLARTIYPLHPML